jgi:hypothetical protein
MIKKSRTKKRRRVFVQAGLTPDLRQDLALTQRWTRLHNEVHEELKQRAVACGGRKTKLLQGFLEIANFILKNTCGVGSNFKLANCRLQELESAEIRKYYTLMLTLLAFHFGQLLPDMRELAWRLIQDLTGDADLMAAFSSELEDCKDHQDGSFSPVRAGRKLWARVAEVLHIAAPEENVTARIYYQTAPGQDLIFLAEKASGEGWFLKV